MELQWFIAAFDRAAARCREFAQQFVSDELPSSLRFDFEIARMPLDEKGRVKFLGGRLLPPTQLRAVDSVLAQKYLWVDGRIPHWINLSVHAADLEHTYIEVCTSARLTNELERLYHDREGNPPFHVLGPALPPGWESVTVNGRFNLPARCTE